MNRKDSILLQIEQALLADEINPPELVDMETARIEARRIKESIRNKNQTDSVELLREDRQR